MHCLLRFGRGFNDELLVVLQLLQSALDIGCRIFKCLGIQDACVIA